MAKKAKSHGIGDIYKFLLVILVLLLSYYLVKSYMDYLKKKEGMYTSANYDKNEDKLILKINESINESNFVEALAGIELSKFLFRKNVQEDAPGTLTPPQHPLSPGFESRMRLPRPGMQQQPPQSP